MQCQVLTKRIENFKGADAYILDTINRIVNLPTAKYYGPRTVTGVSVLLNNIVFNTLK